MEATDADESFNNEIPVTSTDGNNMQHIKQPMQSTHTANMTVNDVTEGVTESLTEDNSQCISSTRPESDSEHPVTPPIAQNQQNNTMEGRNINMHMYHMYVYRYHSVCSSIMCVVNIRLFVLEENWKNFHNLLFVDYFNCMHVLLSYLSHCFFNFQCFLQLHMLPLGIFTCMATHVTMHTYVVCKTIIIDNRVENGSALLTWIIIWVRPGSDLV